MHELFCGNHFGQSAEFCIKYTCHPLLSTKNMEIWISFNHVGSILLFLSQIKENVKRDQVELVIPLLYGKLGYKLGDIQKSKFGRLWSDRDGHGCRLLAYL